MPKTLLDASASDRSIGVREVARLLGVSLSAVYKNRTEIPHFTFGQSIRFKESDVLRFRDSQIREGKTA